jgi:HSP20 family protein
MAELPGIDEKDINVTLRDGVLTLTGEKKTESNGESNGSIYSERLHGNFERSIELGSEINSDKVSTSFKQGVLTVTFAKQTEAQSQVKRILIGREGATRSM